MGSIPARPTQDCNMNRETQLKGFIAETKFIQECAQRKIPVSQPLWDVRYDFILEKDSSLLKVQVKYIGRRKNNIKAYADSKDKGVISVNSYSTNTRGKKQPYTKDEIDVIVAWSEEIERFLWIPIEGMEGKRVKSFRINKPLIKQKKGKINWAKDYYW